MTIAIRDALLTPSLKVSLRSLAICQITLIKPPLQPRKTKRGPLIGSRFEVSCTIRTGRESLSGCPYSPSPTRPSHRSGPGSSPLQHIRNPTERFGVDVTLDPQATASAKLDRDDTCPFARLGDRRLRWRRRRRLDDLYRNELRDGRRGYLTEFLAPAKKLAHMDTGRSRDLGNARLRHDCRGVEPFLLLARPAPTPFDRRNDLNLMLRHRTTLKWGIQLALHLWWVKRGAALRADDKTWSARPFLHRELDAVYNAIELPWSNGQAEGQINRLKTIKRAMYGRAGPELLRARMLPLDQNRHHTK